MNVEYGYDGHRLIATLECGNPKRLQHGRSGWYEVGYAEWKLGWRFRVECSVTRTDAKYGYGDAHGRSSDKDPQRIVYTPANTSFARFAVVQDRIVEISFLLPDALDPFQKRGWGATAQGPIRLAGESYHCGARLIAIAEDYRSKLHRVDCSIEIVQSYRNNQVVLAHIDDIERGRPWRESLFKTSVLDT